MSTLEEQQAAKTVWDWGQLLIAPAGISLAVAWCTHVEQQGDRGGEQLQQEHDQQLADQRATSEREAAEPRAQIEREIATDNQREASGQAYLHHMIDLLVECRQQSKLQAENERPADAEGEVARITRLGTLIWLRSLDAKRKRTALQNLAESELLGPWGIEDADLSEVELSKLKLRNVNLSKTNVSGTKLSGADLLMANLSGAKLSGADLRAAELSGAELSGATVIKEQVTQAKSLTSTTMPDGSTHL